MNATERKRKSRENKKKRELVQNEARKQDNYSKFEKSTLEFEKQCMDMEHKYCQKCYCVSLQFDKSKNYCSLCANKKVMPTPLDGLPIWYNEGNVPQYHVPPELTCLREGEKLLIQQVSVFVPLQHLKMGQLGSQGHVVCFPQDVSGICTVLPRLPCDVSLVRVIKKYKMECGEIGRKTFSIRKKEVLLALKWLKMYNIEYRDIEIDDDNLNWIENGVEEQLPSTVEEVTLDPTILLDSTLEDRGPSEDQIAKVTDIDKSYEPYFGVTDDYNEDRPKKKDRLITEALCATDKANQRKTGKMSFPFVSDEPCCEYNCPNLFELAFPWLFPGGRGGLSSFDHDKRDALYTWMKQKMLYLDMRFAKDRVWCFYALNFMSRHKNQGTGSYFVDGFFKNGPKTLEDLQTQVLDGDNSWLSRITYFSQNVVGSAGYWRSKRREVFSWINHHLEKGNGPPSFFITLSCAEYQWKDIERLIVDRYEKAGLKAPDLKKKGRAGLINDHTLIVQEYFQARVNIWLKTVGKEMLGIKHHWVRYEFAPSRGQIHAHMLAICEDNREILQKSYDLRDKKAQLADYLGTWLSEKAGVTAWLDDCSKSIDKNTSEHPASVRFTDVSKDKRVEDATMCQLFLQQHRCSNYCMRVRKHPRKSESADEKKRRVCRNGAGIEATPGKADTPGFQKRHNFEIVRDPRGFDKVEMPRNNKRTTQTSAYMTQGWRGNCDIQFLLYHSHPDHIDARDISRVTNYVVSYSCKGHESEIEERKQMKELLLNCKADSGDVKDVKRVARRLLNECSKRRVVSRQEATCQLVGLSLYDCSENAVSISLSGYSKLETGKAAKNSLLWKYSERHVSLHQLSLHEFFHAEQNGVVQNRKGWKEKYPNYTGAWCDPVFPATAGYARSILLIYQPWHTKFEGDSVSDEELQTMLFNFMNDKRCPVHVKMGYNQAKVAYERKSEPTSKSGDSETYGYHEQPDEEIDDLVDLVGTLHNDYDDEEDLHEFDYGVNYPWDVPTIEVTHNAETVLQEYMEERRKCQRSDIGIPLRYDGSEYEIDCLAEDQQIVLAEVLQAVKNYSEGKMPVENKGMLRLTVTGVAGSGKSTLINTLVTQIRKIYQERSAALVFAPTGCAAFNAGGETVQRGFGIPRDIKNLKVSSDKFSRIACSFRHTVAIIVDERSMLDAVCLGMMRHHMDECANQGQMKNVEWGGIPVVILVGDDYQLPSVQYGAFYSDPTVAVPFDSTKKAKMGAREIGFNEFRRFGQHVMRLSTGKRVNHQQDQLLRILRDVRCEEDDNDMEERDIRRLLDLHLHSRQFSSTDRAKIEKNSTYVFANKEPRDRKNQEKLKCLNNLGFPVARMKSQTITDKRNKKVSNNSHFDLDRQPAIVRLCHGAVVCLNGINLDPALGLYHGSFGKVVDIVFSEGESPNDGDLPKYVLVEFVQYCGKEFVPGLPKVVPIVPQETRCQFNCCTRRYVPLALAYGKTAHTFQGITVGPMPPGRPPNPIQCIIIEPGKKSFEGQNVGLLYQLLGRGTTIGSMHDKFSSSMYFIGLNFTRLRITKMTKQENGKPYRQAFLRKLWVAYLNEGVDDGSRWTERARNKIFDWARNTRISRKWKP